MPTAASAPMSARGPPSARGGVYEFSRHIDRESGRQKKRDGELAAALHTHGHAVHSEHQYDGMFRGLAVNAKEPLSTRKNTDTKRLHSGTNFAMGCENLSHFSQGPSQAQATYVDHGLIYATQASPEKNGSDNVQLGQALQPEVQFRTEQRENFLHPGAHFRDEAYRAEVKVHLGNDAPNWTSQTKATHVQTVSEEGQHSHRLRAAGAGLLVPTSAQPKPVRCSPIHGGARSTDVHDAGVAKGLRFERKSNNASDILHDAHVRNPLLGHCTPRETASSAAHAPHASTHAVAQANSAVPPLRSLGAVRPHC